jgi:hypothetical protein
METCMAAGIKTTNLPLSTGTVVEVLAHVETAPGVYSLRRQLLTTFINTLRQEAGFDPSAITDLYARITAEVARAVNYEGGLFNALQAETLNRISVDGDLNAQTDALRRLVLMPPGRPGDRVTAFVSDFAGGDPTTHVFAAIPPTITADGAVMRLVGAQNIAARDMVAVEPGRAYQFRVKLRGNGTSKAAITAGIIFLDQNRVPLAGPNFGAQIVSLPNGLTPADGLKEFTALASPTSSLWGVSITMPAGAVYATSFLTSATGEAGLDAIVLELVDATRSASAQEAADRGSAAAGRHLIPLGRAAQTSVATRGVYSTAASDTAGFTGWGLCDVAVNEDVVDGFALYLSVPSTVKDWNIVLVERMPSDLTSDAPPTLLPNDRVLDLSPRVTFTPSKPLQSHFALEEATRVQVDFLKPLYRRQGFGYVFMARAFDASNNLVYVGRIPADMTGRTGFEVGWAFNAAGATVKLPAGLAVAGEIYRRQFDPPRLPGVVQYRGQPQQTGPLVLRYDGVTRVDLTGTRPLTGSSTTHAVTSGKVGEQIKNFTLKQYTTGMLGFANVTNVNVYMASNASQKLVAEVDYHVDPSGRIYGLGDPNLPDRIVNITLDWAKERWDLVVEVPEQNSIGVKAGVERMYSAHEDMYRPKPASSMERPLYWVRVVGLSIVEVIPAWEWIGTFSVLRQPEIDTQMNFARRQLGRILRKLVNGDGIIVAGYGDSNTQIGGGGYVDATSFEPNRNNANGATDLPGFTGDFYDLLATEADFKSAFFASCPTVTLNGLKRYKTGPNWKIIDQICRDYGYTFVADKNPGPGEITYLNCGIGATTMQATAGNMGDPARLDALCNPIAYGPGYRKPDLIIIQAGMNGTPDPTYPYQVDQVIQGIQARCQADILMYGMHLTNLEGTNGAPGNRFTMNAWKAVNAQTREAALRNGVAFAPTDMIQGPGFEGYFGISATSACRTNLLNHPGPYERRKVGEFLATLFSGGAGIGTDGTSTASARRILTLPRDPTAADIPKGGSRLVRNTSNGYLSLWANDNGSIIDLVLSSGMPGGSGASKVSDLTDATLPFRALNVADTATQLQNLGAASTADLLGFGQDMLKAVAPIDPSNGTFQAALAEVLLAFINGLPTAQPATAGWWNNGGQITYFTGT